MWIRNNSKHFKIQFAPVNVYFASEYESESPI